MKHILVPIDFSPESAYACAFAADLAFRTQSHLVLLHAFEAPLLPSGSGWIQRGAGLHPEAERLQAAALERLADFASTHVTPRVPHIAEAQPGSPAEVILRYGRLEEVKAVVLGTKGAKGWTGGLRGSISAEILRSSDLPTFIVPRREAPVAWERLVLASDLRSDETAVFRAFSALGRLYQSEVTLLHVHPEGGIEETMHPALEPLLAGSELQNWGRVTLEAPDVETGLHRFTEEQGTDLLALSTQTHSLWEQLFHRSLARQEAVRAALPLLIFHRFTGAQTSTRGLELFD